MKRIQLHLPQLPHRGQRSPQSSPPTGDRQIPVLPLELSLFSDLLMGLVVTLVVLGLLSVGISQQQSGLLPSAPLSSFAGGSL